MEIAAIILGLLIWFAVPPFFKGKLGPNAYKAAAAACRALGIVVIAIGILRGILR